MKAKSNKKTIWYYVMMIAGVLAILSTICIFIPALTVTPIAYLNNVTYVASYLLAFGGQITVLSYFSYTLSFNFLFLVIWLLPVFCGIVAILLNNSKTAMIVLIVILVACGILMLCTKPLFLSMNQDFDGANIALAAGPIIGAVLSFVSAVLISLRLVNSAK